MTYLFLILLGFFQPILIMTNVCNLACKYRYANEGSYGINECQTMSADVVEKVVDYVISFDRIYHDDNRIYKDGLGSMKDTIKGIRLLNDFKFEYYITCCLIPSELYRIDENIQFIRSVIGDMRINILFIRGAVENVQQSI